MYKQRYRYGIRTVSIGRLVQVQIEIEIVGTVNGRDPHMHVQVQAGALGAV